MFESLLNQIQETAPQTLATPAKPGISEPTSLDLLDEAEMSYVAGGSAPVNFY